MILKVAGKNPSGKLLEKLKNSRNYKTDKFVNLSDTPMTLQGISAVDLIKKFIRKNSNTRPPQPIPSVKTNLKSLTPGKTTIVWFGHSSYLINIEGKNILVDPVLSGNASPMPFMIKAFKGSDAYITDDLPAIDFLIITHDHYDHLDYKTIKKLRSKVKSIYCSLGVSSHLVYWGFDKNIITGMDWWQTNYLGNGLSLTATPARHFSGRGLKRFKTLWSSFILMSPDQKLYLGGDSGYDFHFKKIAEQFAPFDLVILESGQYNEAWPLIHMMPEQTVQAAIDLQAKVLLPVHWGKFSLALHPWNEPAKRARKAALDLNQKITFPRIGEPVILNEIYPIEKWWDF
jgi:L-ascorbate metabolism protein UlaG (beta-lactamase superfamily)